MSGEPTAEPGTSQSPQIKAPLVVTLLDQTQAIKNQLSILSKNVEDEDDQEEPAGKKTHTPALLKNVEKATYIAVRCYLTWSKLCAVDFQLPLLIHE